MLDWRAATATTIVHVAMGMMATATLSWMSIVCRFPIPDGDISIVEPHRLTSFSLWDRVSTSDAAIRIESMALTASTPCETDHQAPLPQIQDAPLPVSVTMAAAKASMICLVIDRMGVVTSARLYRSSGDPARDRRAIRSARRARFVADRPGGVAITL